MAMNDIIRKRMNNYNEKLASNAYRVMGFAYKRLGNFEYKSTSMVKQDNKLIEGLVFVGFAAVMDPPREDVFDAISKCISSGIKPVMITGDHRNTALAIAKETGIFKKGDIVVTGDELDRDTEVDLYSKIDKISVFARVSPGHKLKIVRLLKRKGNIVAMTGDGVNDAPAVKASDIGIAMGENGTDVTKEAASIILLDDRFSSIMDAVIEGRIIYLNIRKAITYLLSCNVGEVVTMLVGSVLGFPVVLLPVQILWVNLVTDGLPAIGLACDIPDRKTIINNQSYNSDNILHNGLIKTIMVRGVIMGFITLAIFLYYMKINGNIDIARTNAFYSMIFLQLIYAFECRGRKGRAGRFMVSVFLSLIFALIVLINKFLREMFSIVTPTIDDWALIIGSSIAVSLILSIKKLFRFNNQTANG
jgi:Ca2+-transporting ATPase